jgi:hypothetical protein
MLMRWGQKRGSFGDAALLAAFPRQHVVPHGRSAPHSEVAESTIFPAIGQDSARLQTFPW